MPVRDLVSQLVELGVRKEDVVMVHAALVETAGTVFDPKTSRAAQHFSEHVANIPNKRMMERHGR